MADTLKVYKGTDLVGSAERGSDGTASVTINELEANTDYPAGTFQVAFANDNGESTKVNVPAFKTNPIKVTGVTLDKTELALNVGDSATLQATVSPSTATDKTLTYATSDNAIATVDENGVVTAVAAGTANITVTTNDGSKTATCNLTVSEATPEEPQNVNVDSNETDADVTAE
ncbi:Ig-like domain-containing protein [Staphylococcus gallinarum]|uniref:Ig-like domain-containing protein n=1 Tax=Staphylococcus gallinarum TaxID=1293 RepID=UPI00227EB989|nr:Ig-like domain-containing protein [Staphylococcus gallinarum]MDN6414797.1 Ig-like domain-containing protein [Staphylococcus gallinarum]